MTPGHDPAVNQVIATSFREADQVTLSSPDCGSGYQLG